jgi:ER membrane protein complex subunit 3
MTIAAANQMTQQMQMQQSQMQNPMGGAEDPEKPFLNEAENLEVVEHWYILDGIENRLLEKLGTAS